MKKEKVETIDQPTDCLWCEFIKRVVEELQCTKTTTPTTLGNISEEEYRSQLHKEISFTPPKWCPLKKV